MNIMMTRKLLRSWLAFAWFAALLIGMQTATATESVTYYYEGAQGSVLATTDAAGHVLTQTEYRPFGMPAQGSNAPGPGFAGHVDDDTGLVYMQARYYDPAIGRFLSPDPSRPAAGDLATFGRYAYVGNNPVIHVDPTGRVQDDDCSAACVLLRRISDSFTRLYNGIGNTSSSPTTPVAALNATNEEFDQEATGGAAATSATAAPVADLLPGATLAACYSGVDCSSGEMAVAVLGVIPEVGEVGEAVEAEQAVQSLIQINRAAGKAAEERAAVDLVSKGYEILGRQVAARTDLGRRVIDILARSPGGELIAIEVKSGNATRNSAQLAKDALMANKENGAVIIGKNAPDTLRDTRQVIRTEEHTY